MPRILFTLLLSLLLAHVPVPPPVTAAAPVRVAVLPFATPKGKPDMEQYGVGMMDSLIVGLQNVPEFVVIDRGNLERIMREQAFQQSGLVDPKTAVKLGKLLAAQVLVGGSIVQAGKQIRIVATFTEVGSGKIQQAKQVTGALNDIFDLQDQLARQFIVAQAVPVTPVQQQRVAAVLKSTASLPAYQAYLRGRKAYLLFTPEGFAAAIKEYQQAIKTDPKYALAYAALGDTYLHWAYQKQQHEQPFLADYQAAYDMAVKALAINPDLAMAHRVKGAAAYRMRMPGLDSPALREAEARKAVELSPNDAENWYELWKATGSESNPDHGYIKKALELDPNLVGAMIDRAVALHALKRLDEAVPLYRRGLQLSPASPYLHNNLGLALTDLKRYDESLVSLREAIRLYPGYANAYNNMGNALARLGRFDEALAAYQESIRLQPKLAIPYNGMALALIQLKRFNEAVAAFKDAIRLDPSRPAPYLNLGDLFQAAGQYAPALDAYLKAAKLMPPNADLYNAVGVCLIKLQRYDEAIKVFEEALKADPNHAAARETRNELRRLLGK